MLIGSVGAGSDEYARWKYSATAFHAKRPERTHRPACGSNGKSTAARRSEAASSTAPHDVIHDRCARGERKKLRTPSEVCVSSSSANQSCHGAHRSPRRSKRCISWERTSTLTPVGGSVERAASIATSTSRRENAP
jgi:hypothetical protein